MKNITYLFDAGGKLIVQWIMEHKELIPIWIAAAVFILNIFRQNFVRKKEIRDRLGSELIHICDKMIRIAMDIEMSCLEFRRYEAMIKIEKDDKEYKAEGYYCYYYHKKAEGLIEAYGMLKSDLKRCVKDFNKYWANIDNKKLILEIMNRIVFMEMRAFRSDLCDKYKTKTQIDVAADKIQDGIREHIMFNNIGFHLIYIQRLIDKKSPMLYLKTKELNDRLNEKINNYSKYAMEVDGHSNKEISKNESMKSAKRTD